MCCLISSRDAEQLADDRSRDRVPDHGVQVVADLTVEARGVGKPVCVAQLVTRQYAEV